MTMMNQRASAAPGLLSFVKSLKHNTVDHSVEYLVSMLRRRQIRGSQTCAVAVTQLFLRLIVQTKYKTVVQLLERVRSVGRQLIEAQPTELVVGNTVRRVMGLVREVSDVSSANDDAATYPPVQLLASHGYTISPGSTLEIQHVTEATVSCELPTMREVKEDMLNGLREMLDELDQADEQIAGYALEHIHTNEVILTYTSSLTVQKFLLSAAKKRKFSVVHVEGYPDLHLSTQDTIVNGRKLGNNEDKSDCNRLKSVVAAGIKVTMIPDSAVFAVMSRVHKVVLPADAVFSDGSFMAATGTRVIARAAKSHHVPVIALAAIYKHSPLYPLNVDELGSLGDAGFVTNYRDGELVSKLDVMNPVSDYVPSELSDLIISNIGAFTPSFVYQIIADHYRDVDIDLVPTENST